MKRIKDESITKIINDDNNNSAIGDFQGRANFLFVQASSSEMLNFAVDPPQEKQIKKKALIVIKARPESKEAGFPSGVANEVVFMELTRPILENLYNTCQEVFLPILHNPLNQVNLSDLVSKDLMEKFNSFMAYTYVTIGQVKGRTLLPLPPSDVTNSERTSSKDKAHILETAIIHW
jgi:dynein heavy chain